jgi:hypothetical protein
MTWLARTTLLSLVLAAGCEPAHFAAAQREDSEASYLRYLAAHPGGDKAPAAQRRLEELRYRAARNADRPIGYRLYLERHPSGRFAQECRERLAALAIARAQTAAGYRLVLERYPGTQEAARAALLLPRVLAVAARASGSPSLAQAFLDEHGGSNEAPAVRAHLARLLYRRLVDGQNELEAFAQDFAGTPEAQLATARLERLLAAEVAETRDEELLRQLRARFPSSAQLPELTRAVQRGGLDRAIVALDLEALAVVSSEDEEGRALQRVVAWCRARAARCQAIVALAKRALPWQPAELVETLRGRVYDADPRVASEAIGKLGAVSDRAAGVQLVELLGSQRLSTVWIAERALVAWLAARGGEERRAWIARQLRRPHRSANEDEVQRRGALCLIGDREEEGQRLLLGLVSQTGRMFAVSYLLLRHASRRARPLSTTLRASLVAAARTRVDWLKDAFPAEVHKESLVAASLAERELAAVDGALRDLYPAAPPSDVVELRRAIDQLLGRWRARLIAVDKTYPITEIPSFLVASSKHDQGREAALRQLQRSVDPPAKIVAAAICRVAPLATACRERADRSRAR